MLLVLPTFKSKSCALSLLTVNTILDNLNPPQQEAVSFDNGPLLILAGAGSGKTKVLTHRAAWLIQEKKVNPDNMLLVTFTNKAAREMRDRIVNITQGKYPTPLTTTFHSFCARILRRDGKYLGIPPSFVIYDDDDQKDAIKQILSKLNLGGSVKPGPVLATISSAKNELIDPEQYEEIATGEWQRKVALIYRLYQKMLLEGGAVDFDDLLSYSVKLMREFPETLSKYQNYYSYLLVDEWQDTNRAQYQLTKFIVNRHKNLTAVGDAAQSIYSWRGADHRNIDYLKQDFPSIKIINLEQNYRSTQTILDAAYKVISKNTSHPILKLWTENGNGAKITLYQARNEQEEASFVVREITRLAGKYRLKDFAILYRTNAQSRVIEEAMLHAGIPYILVGGVRFYTRREIKDVLCYLRLIANPKDIISKSRVEKLGKGRLKKFEELIQRYHESNLPAGKAGHSSKTTLEILDETLDKTGYLSLYNPADPEDASRLENIKELRSVATEFPNLIEFLEQIALVESAQTDKGKPLGNPSAPFDKTQDKPLRAITLMTAHAAKGLEFSVVFMVGLEEGLFPHSRSADDKEELEEERRLCYVGMTRAKEKLYITFAARRLIFGQRSTSIPSRFIIDIPEYLLESPIDFSRVSQWLWHDKLTTQYEEQ